MSDQVEIVNRALTKLGAGRIASISDNNKRAIVMESLWDTVRKSELAKRRWSFSITRAALPASATVPAWGFAKTYPLPADYLSLVQVNDFFVDPNFQDYTNEDNSAWKIENVDDLPSILTDFTAPLKIRYVKDITDPGLFHSLFVEVFASKLAYEGCEEITNSNAKRQAAMDDYMMALKEGVRNNAIELPPQGYADGSWMLGRL